MLFRGDRPHERLGHAWVESAIDALVGGMDGMGSTPPGVQRPRAVGKSSRVLAVCTPSFECRLEYQCRRDFRGGRPLHPPLHRRAPPPPPFHLPLRPPPPPPPPAPPPVPPGPLRPYSYIPSAPPPPT